MAGIFPKCERDKKLRHLHMYFGYVIPPPTTWTLSRITFANILKSHNNVSVVTGFFFLSILYEVE